MLDEVTPEQVKQSMIDKNITWVDHHRCSICNSMTGYLRIDDNLYFDSSCDCCPSSSPVYRDWRHAADWINMNVQPKYKQELKQAFGITNE